MRPYRAIAIKRRLNGMDVYQLVYCSRSTAEAANRRAEIEGLVATSRRNNRAAGISGGLFVTRDIFAQMIEGTQDAIERLKGTIRVDPRHRDFTVLREAAAPRRMFPTWAMGFEITDDPTDEMLEVLDEAFTHPSAAAGTAIIELIKNSIVQIDLS
jgi:hypothetical protein